jgi:flagellar hook-associated protein FlgK
VESFQSNYQNQLEGTVTRVNQLVSQIADADKAVRDAGSESLADTRVYGALEELSKLIDFKVLHGSDGSLTLLGGGQVPLVQGGKAFPLSVEPSSSGTDRPLPQVVDAFGKNVSSVFRSGEVAGLVELTNTILPSMIGGGGATGVLNDLAKELGTAVNGALSPGNPIFTWSPAAGPNAASTFAAVSGFQTSDLPTTGTSLTNLAALRTSSLPG